MSGVIQSDPCDVGGGFAVEFRFDGARLDCLWSPAMPEPETATALFPRYLQARDAFLSKLAAVTKSAVAVVDAP